jgi:hypothetical protein
VQVALKAAQKQLAALQCEAKKRPSSSNNSSNNSSSRPHGAAAGSSAGSSDPALQQKLSELEGALRQAMSDYALILRELGAMRAEGSSRQAGLEAAVTEKAAADAELNRWVGAGGLCLRGGTVGGEGRAMVTEGSFKQAGPEAAVAQKAAADGDFNW